MITTPDGRQDKYAQIERERRYLLSCLPPALAMSDQFLRIVDCYLPKMHLFPGMGAVPPCPLPGCLREVTANPAFQGGQLAQLSPEECRRWLGAILGREEEGGR